MGNLHLVSEPLHVCSFSDDLDDMFASLCKGHALMADPTYSEAWS